MQQCRRAFAEQGENFSYEQLVQMATGAPAFRSLIDPNDGRFLNPPDMPKAMQEFCQETGQPKPETEGQFVRCALESLALTYAGVLDGLEELTGVKIEVIHIVGGGSRNQLLNQLTANACARRVVAGPVEATVLGNLLVQARSHGEVQSLADIREVISTSSELTQFEPADTDAWRDARGRFAALCQRKS